jgi:hypothetical protein
LTSSEIPCVSGREFWHQLGSDSKRKHLENWHADKPLSIDSGDQDKSMTVQLPGWGLHPRAISLDSATLAAFAGLS